MSPKTNVPKPARVVVVGDNYKADTKSNLNTRKGDNSKSKKTRVVILIRDMSSLPVLHFYQVS